MAQVLGTRCRGKNDELSIQNKERKRYGFCNEFSPRKTLERFERLNAKRCQPPRVEEPLMLSMQYFWRSTRNLSSRIAGLDLLEVVRE